MDEESKLTSLKNIGPAMAQWLKQAGITTPKQLHELGAVECYLRISKLHRNAANRMALYALYGAIHDINCLKLAPEIKDMLNGMVEDAKN